ncbi:MAG TPA: hypothetical protein DHW15_13210 [Bacteroidetes bacterium]|jgi:hypothetical protein|nr:MAG: hypothetical protein ABR95_02245 [Sphingobacteriales bacterium BACL12 MAG-120813-bin55]HCK23069.1 hypothetical protein [Bacteroidota bacterium]
MQLNISTPIPVIDGSSITREFFETNYLKPQKPVVLRGLWKQYPAYTKWTADYFAQVMGDIEVGLYSTKQSDPSKTLTIPTVKMKFSEYMDLIRHSDTDLRLFLFPVFKHRPELLKDFGYPDISGKYIKLPFMFFGPKNSITRMHQDIDMSNVFLTQFEGKKRVVLFPPDQSRLLYKLPFNVHSTVDIDNPDFEKYPALRYAEGMTTVLEYGDTLFMPSGYWHHIEYLEGGYGLSVRTMAPTIALRLQAVYHLTLERWMDTALNKLLGKNWFEYKKKLAYRRAEQAMENNHYDNDMNHTPTPAFH